MNIFNFLKELDRDIKENREDYIFQYDSLTHSYSGTYIRFNIYMVHIFNGSRYVKALNSLDSIIATIWFMKNYRDKNFKPKVEKNIKDRVMTWIKNSKNS